MIPTIAVIRATNLLTDAEVQSFVVALQFAHDKYLGPAWDVQTNFVFVPPGQKLPDGAWQLWLQDRTTIPGDLGFHDVESGVPIGRAFVDDARQDGYPWEVPASHEAWEMRINPTIDRMVSAVIEGKVGVIQKECADACEDPRFAIEVEGLNGAKHSISACLTPAWFDPYGKPPFSCPVIPQIDAPFRMADGGYVAFQPDGGTWTQVMADVAGPLQVKREGSRFLQLRDGLGSMGTAAMTAAPTPAMRFRETILDPGIAWCAALPGWNIPLDNPARLMLLAIAGQESGWQNVQQGGHGPGIGPWQFEPETCGELLTNPSSAPMLHAACAALKLPRYDEQTVWAAILGNPNLAVALARLDLWCDPYPLPSIGDEAHAWHYYVSCWRPGKPGPDRWPANYKAAMAALGLSG